MRDLTLSNKNTDKAFNARSTFFTRRKTRTRMVTEIQIGFLTQEAVSNPKVGKRTDTRGN